MSVLFSPLSSSQMSTIKASLVTQWNKSLWVERTQTLQHHKVRDVRYKLFFAVILQLKCISFNHCKNFLFLPVRLEIKCESIQSCKVIAVLRLEEPSKPTPTQLVVVTVLSVCVYDKYIVSHDNSALVFFKVWLSVVVGMAATLEVGWWAPGNLQLPGKMCIPYLADKLLEVAGCR